MTDAPDNETMTITDCMAYLRTSRSEIYRLMHRQNNPLVFFRITSGGKWIIRRMDFLDWIAQNSETSEVW